MRTATLVRRSLARTLRQHGFITVLVTLLVLVTVVVSWFARGATYGTAQELTSGLGSRQIEVIQGYGGPGSPELDPGAVDFLENLDGVTDVFPTGTSGIEPPESVRETGNAAQPWWLTPQNPVDDRLKDADGQRVRVLTQGQMLVPVQFEDLVGTTVEVGVTVAMDASQGRARPESFEVVGSYNPDSIQGETPNAVFINPGQFAEIQSRALPPGTPLYTSAFVYVADVDDVAPVQARIEEHGFGARSAIGSGVQLSQAREGLALVSLLLLAITVLGSLFAGTSVSGAWMTSRNEEIGLFRSLGWTRREIVRLYLCEALLFALGTAVIGVLLGAAVVLALTAMPSVLSSVAGVRMDPAELAGQAWVALVPLIAVPLGFALGTVRRAGSLLRADTDALLRQT